MNRRSFIKRMAVAVAGVAAGASLLTDSVTAKVVTSRLGRKAIVNPAWLTASYEQSFVFHPEVFNSLKAVVMKTGTEPEQMFAMRSNSPRMKDGMLEEPIYPFVEFDTRSDEEKYWDAVDQWEYEQANPEGVKSA